MSGVRSFLEAALAARVPAAGWRALGELAAEVARGVEAPRFANIVSLASRHTPRGPLAPSADELGRASALLSGWSVERWTTLEAVRAWLVLGRGDLARASAVAALEECFAFADIGEACALYKTLPLLPAPERFVWRVGEGCRSSMGAVYQAAACDSPFPVKHFDALGWRQLVIKAFFVGAPAWRIVGLDTRLDAELARMALDLCDERRSAHRPVPHELWLALGAHGGARGIAALEQELTVPDPRSRRAAALALARAGQRERLTALAQGERDAQVRSTIEGALRGECTQLAWRALEP